MLGHTIVGIVDKYCRQIANGELAAVSLGIVFIL
jgi:hypothetical protein